LIYILTVIAIVNSGLAFAQVKNNLQESENRDFRDECMRGQVDPIIKKSVLLVSELIDGLNARIDIKTGIDKLY
jgi:hypothetical protein